MTTPIGIPPYVPSGNELECHAGVNRTEPKSKRWEPPTFMPCPCSPFRSA